MIATNENPRFDLLLADNDPEFRHLAAEYFASYGYRVEQASDGGQALELANGRVFDVALVDSVMPKLSGIEFLQKRNDADCKVILLTKQGTIESAVEAMKLGACDFLEKPIRLSDLQTIVERACNTARLSKENRQWRAVVQRTQMRSNMIGESPEMQEIYRLIERAGPADKPILILGESGTGKELVARALHQSSSRADKPMVVINCAALPEMLLESELFGHEKGSYTGATSAKQGLFEIADGGTLFIDEIGEMAPGLQAKLLRVLEDGSLRRVGAVNERRVNVRLLTATNRDLHNEVKAGRFREDLYYRIDVMNLSLPPLRDRGEDIWLLANYFAGGDWQIEPEVMRAFEHYAWPGNVRELINAIERAQILADDKTIQWEHLPTSILEPTSYEPKIVASTTTDLESIKRQHILQVYDEERHNKVRTARSLGVSRRSLYRLLEKYDIAVG